MKKIKINFRLLTLGAILILFGDVAYAQGTAKKEDFFSKIKGIRNFFETAPLNRTFSDINKQEEESLSDIPGVSAETAKIVRSLRNPFEPQLPAPETPLEEPPPDQNPVDEMDNRQNTRKDRPNIDIITIKKPSFTPSKYTVSGLIWDSDRPQVIINDQVLSIGDQINDITITNIEKDGVEINFHDKTFLLK